MLLIPALGSQWRTDLCDLEVNLIFQARLGFTVKTSVNKQNSILNPLVS